MNVAKTLFRALFDAPLERLAASVLNGSSQRKAAHALVSSVVDVPFGGLAKDFTKESQLLRTRGSADHEHQAQVLNDAMGNGFGNHWPTPEQQEWI